MTAGGVSGNAPGPGCGARVGWLGGVHRRLSGPRGAAGEPEPFGDYRDEQMNVNIFWDNSNIFIPARYVATRREGGFAEQNIRIQFDNLYQLARAGRQVNRAVCVGSVPPELRAVWDRLRAIGITVELYERGAGTGTEQGVDQCLQVHMLRALADATEPEVAVLLTGDGQGYETGAGFHADLERMAAKRWGVEVIS